MSASDKPLPPRPPDGPKRPVPAAPAARPAPAKAAPAKAAAAPRAAAPAAKGAAKPAASKPAAAKPSAPPPPAAPPDPLIGQTLGRCKLVEKIGQGRTATVYRAINQATDGVVAVKVLLPQARANAEIVAKFQREARAIAKIDNENVLKIYDVGQQGEEHYLVMELLDGEEILELIAREGRMEPTDALRVVRQAANGLTAAHAQGIIHRDVKPGNLVLLEDGTVKVVDFGLAADVDAESQRVGTPHYMAPETCEKGESGPASDIYSLGISLYHLLIGQPPYAGQTVKEMLASHVAGEPLKPERKLASLKKEISDFVRLLTRRDPKERPSATEVVEALDKIGGQELKKKDALRGRSPRFRASAQARAGSKGSQGTLILAVLGIGAVIAAIAIFSGGSGDGPAPKSEGGGSRTSPDPAGGSRGKGPETNVPIPPRETPEQAAAREKMEAEKAKAAQEVEARTALQAIEGWIRQSWHSKSDDGAAAARYRNHAKQFKGTEAAKTSEERARLITAGKLHAHPDKSYDAADAIESVRQAWAEARPKVEAALATHAYAEARKLVPEAVQDAEGSLASELAFWAMVTEHVRSLQVDLAGVNDKLPDDAKSLTLAQGKVRLKRIGTSTFEVDQDGTAKSLAWTEVPPAEIARVAKSALAGKGTRVAMQLMAFAWVHRIDELFWGSELEVGMASDRGPFERDVQSLKRTWEERLATK
jgi:serine/threonine-protein kinase